MVADESAGGADVATAVDADREVISTGSMTITAEDPVQAADDAARIVERAGGRIDSRSEQPPLDSAARGADGEVVPSDGSVGGDDGSATLVVRIPSADLTATLDEVKQLGEVEDVSIAASDVTAVAQDLDARITALSASVDRLLALLAGSTTTKDLIDIESVLSDRQSNLESLEAQRRSLADQVSLATISLYFGSEANAPVDTPENFFSGLALGWEALVGFGSVAIIAFGVALPWLAVAAIATAVVFLVLRTRRSRGPQTVLPGAGGDTTMEA